MSHRRYDDDEVAEILARATRVARALPTEPSGAPAGLSLGELQAIGSEVGISPERIAQAAEDLDRKALVPAPRTLLGTPRSVARIVPLERPLDDEEWERLVAELRATFGAMGKLSVQGSLRTWRNGNLQAHVEPEGEGWRLRLQTLKGDAGPAAGMGVVFALVGALILVLSMVGGIDTRSAVLALAFMGAGLAQLGYLRITLPRWAEERATQMEALAERIPALLKP